MNQLYLSANYILVLKDGEVIHLEYPCGKSVYSESADNITIFEDGRGTMIIPKTEIDAGEWENDLSVVYTQATLLTFLRGNTGNFSSASGGSEAWVRPTDWLTIPSITIGEQVVYGLFAVYDYVDSNYVAFSCTGAYNVDWGDGSPVQSVATNVIAQHQYDWADVGNVTSGGWRQALIKITPQIANNITNVNFFRAHSTVGIGKSSQWMDMVLNIPNVLGANLIFAGNITTIRHSNIQRFYVKEIGAVTTLTNLFTNCYALQEVPLFITSSVTNFSFMFNNCHRIKIIPPFNTISGTNFGSTFSNCYALGSIPTFNYSSVVSGFGNMFSNCYNLKEFIGNLSTIVFFPTGMFSVCVSLQKVTFTGMTRGVSFVNCLMSTTEINNMFTSLGTASGVQTITVTGNHGASSCNPLIATAKGFTVAL